MNPTDKSYLLQLPKVLVEHALSHASQEAEQARVKQKEEVKSTLPMLLDIFGGLDKDQNGSLTRQEVAGVPLSVLPPRVLENISVSSFEDLFEMLDVDGGGTLTQYEFLEGLLSLLLNDVPLWALKLQRVMVPIRKHTMQLASIHVAIKELKELIIVPM